MEKRLGYWFILLSFEQIVLALDTNCRQDISFLSVFLWLGV